MTSGHLLDSESTVELALGRLESPDAPVDRRVQGLLAGERCAVASFEPAEVRLDLVQLELGRPGRALKGA